MSINHKSRKWGYRSTIVLTVAILVLGTGACNRKQNGQEPKEKPIVSLEPWIADQLVEPEELARILVEDLPIGKTGMSAQPILLHVGFPSLFEVSHIPGSIYTGAASKQEGVDGLKKEVQNLSRDQEIVLYCGCCPWEDCPNIRPAFESMQEMGFAKIEVLYLPENLEEDWINRGFPIEMGE